MIGCVLLSCSPHPSNARVPEGPRSSKPFTSSLEDHKAELSLSLYCHRRRKYPFRRVVGELRREQGVLYLPPLGLMKSPPINWCSWKGARSGSRGRRVSMEEVSRRTTGTTPPYDTRHPSNPGAEGPATETLVGSLFLCTQSGRVLTRGKLNRFHRPQVRPGPVRSFTSQTDSPICPE